MHTSPLSCDEVAKGVNGDGMVLGRENIILSSFFGGWVVGELFTECFFLKSLCCDQGFNL